MKKILLSLLILVLGGCAQDEYRLKINNDLAEDHGKSVYFRSNLRSNYAGQIRRTLSQKFSEMGLKAATSPENADLIAIFDIETFYAQTEAYKNTSYANTEGDSVLFTDQEEANSLDYSGNALIHASKPIADRRLDIGNAVRQGGLVESALHVIADIASAAESITIVSPSAKQNQQDQNPPPAVSSEHVISAVTVTGRHHGHIEHSIRFASHLTSLLFYL